MPQGDLNIANQSGAAFRADLNNQLLALGTLQSGPSEPSTTYAYQWWADTSADQLKIRNAANNDWITVGTLSAENLGLLATGDFLPLTGGTLTGELVLEGQLTGTDTGLRLESQDGGKRYEIRANEFDGVSANVRFRQTGSSANDLEFIFSTADNADKAISINPDTGRIAGADRLRFSTGASIGSVFERMRITADGDVGIGTTSPAEQLHITDNFRIGSAVFETPSGSAPIYACRAWVNFDGTTATPSTIRGSGNVSSVTRNGSGDYTVNFSTAMPNANYATTITHSAFNTGTAGNNGNGVRHFDTNGYLSSSIRFLISDVGGLTDRDVVNVAIFR